MMKKVLVLGCILMMMCGFSHAISNLQLRGCIDDVTNEEHGQCHQHLKRCFEVKECGQEFTLLFNDCQMPLDDKAFDLECFQRGQKRIEHAQNLELAKCFDEVCGMFGGQPTANMEEIEKNIMENLEKQKEEYEKNRSRSETEEFLCVKSALTDPEKCYKLADECDEECSEDLNKLKSCSGDNDNDCIYDIEGALPHLVNPKAINLTQCLHKFCYLNQPKTETGQQETKQTAEQTVVEEL